MPTSSIDLKESSQPANPDAGRIRLYATGDGTVRAVDSNGLLLAFNPQYSIGLQLAVQAGILTV